MPSCKHARPRDFAHVKTSTRHDPGPGITAPIPMSAYEPMRKQVEAWQRSELTDVTAKVAIYEAFVEGELEAPKHLARTVHDLYFEPLRFSKRNGSNAGCIVTRSLPLTGPVSKSF